MNFTSSMAAKEFIVSRIAEEASRQQVGLSELERKILFFSEGYSTLPDMMEVNERFEATCDAEQYEEKIRKLSRQAFERDRKESPEDAALWRDAVRALGKAGLLPRVQRQRKEVRRLLGRVAQAPGKVVLRLPRANSLWGRYGRGVAKADRNCLTAASYCSLA